MNYHGTYYTHTHAGIFQHNMPRRKEGERNKVEEKEKQSGKRKIKGRKIGEEKEEKRRRN